MSEQDMTDWITPKQRRAYELAAKILADNFNNHVIIADVIGITGDNKTVWQYNGNINAALGMLRRYDAAILHVSNGDK